MPSQNNLLDPQSVKKSKKVRDPGGDVITRGGAIGLTKSSAGHGQNVKAVCKLWCEVVKDVRVVSQSRQKQQSFALPAPIEVMKSDPVRLHKAALVRGGICPGRCLSIFMCA